MPYIGNPIYQAAFVTDQFSGDGTTTAFTMSVAPAGTSNVLVVVSGVVQDPSTYGVVGTTLTFTGAPPSGTGNISCRYLGVPATGVTTTAYRTVTEFTATAAQTTFTPPSYDVGFINVYRNGVLLGSADYTATNGTTVVLATGATAGDLVTVESFLISSVANAISNTAGSVNSTNIADGAVGTAEIADDAVDLTTKVTGVLPEANGGTGTTTGYYGFKNRLINGQMTIDQRNTGASVTASVAGTVTYTLDRWAYYGSAASKFTVQQNAGSVTPPTGFTNYLGVTSSSAYSVGSGEQFIIRQNIEGYNIADLGWGYSNAQAVTLSFWVRSSLTGTFTGNVCTATGDRSLIFTYTINSANTWEQKSVTIAGDTSGGSSWLTTNGIGITLNFSLGAGSSLNGTANTWNGSYLLSVSGAQSIVGTSGATFYITGVQLEKGSTATSFDYRPYGTELALCQRYYFDFRPITGVATYITSNENGNAGGGWVANINFPVPMRATPTLNSPGTYTGTDNFRINWVFAGSTQVSSIAGIYRASPYSMEFSGTKTSAVWGTGYCVFLEVNSALSSTIGALAEL